MIFTSSYAIEVGDEVWLYCGGWDGDHGESGRFCNVYIAKWRLDGFASLSGTGKITTKPMTFDGSDLYLNANASKGSVTVTITDGITTLTSNVITTDDVDYKVTWQNGGSLSVFNGKTVTMTINSTNADIYSFNFK